MNLIKRKHVINNINDGVVLINSYNGSVDFLTSKEYKIILDNMDDVLIIKKNSPELYNFLIRREYIIDKDEDLLLKELRDEQNKQLESKKIDCVYIVTNYKCNFNCTYCFEENIEKDTVIEESMIDMIYNIVHNKANKVNIFGGEPLLPENKDVLSYIANTFTDTPLEVTTNGYYLSEYIDFLYENKIFVIVTLDGMKNTHNKTRQGFDTILSGVEKCIHRGIKLKVRSNIEAENIESVYELHRFFREKYENIDIEFEMCPQFDTPDFFECTLDVFNRELRSREYKDTLQYLPIINSILAGEKYYPKVYNCNAHYAACYFDPYGHMYSCGSVLGDEKLKFGDYYPEYKIDESSFWLKYNFLNHSECKECSLSLLCGGGCVLSRFNMENGISNCDKAKHLLTKILTKILKEVDLYESNNNS